MLPWTLLAAFRPIQTSPWRQSVRNGAVRWSWLNKPSRRTSGCDQSSVKPEKQSQRSEDREFSASASSKRTDLGFCALTIVFVRAFGLLTGGYPCFYDGPGPRGRLLGNDDSRVTSNPETIHLGNRASDL